MLNQSIVNVKDYMLLKTKGCYKFEPLKTNIVFI